MSSQATLQESFDATRNRSGGSDEGERTASACRYRRWMLTSFGTVSGNTPAERVTNCLEILWTKLKPRYAVVGFEICPTTRKEHFQCYVCFGRPTRMPAITRALTGTCLAGSHLDGCNGTHKQAMEYCQKDGVWEEKGTPPQQGKRTDMEDVRRWVTEKYTITDAFWDARSGQSLNTFSKFRALIHTENNCQEKKVIWITGPTGSGKTRRVWNDTRMRYKDEEVYWAMNNKWWDGFDQHKCVVMDDLRHDDYQFQYLLRLLDRYPVRVEVKGSSVQFAPERVYITSIHHPREFVPLFERDSGKLEQLERRISEIITLDG